MNRKGIACISISVSCLLLVALLAGGALLVRPAAAQQSFAGQTLVITDWGGPWGESLRRNVAAPFEKKYGVTVKFDVGKSYENLAKVRLQRHNPQIDILFVDYGASQWAAQEGLTVPLSNYAASIPNLADVYPQAVAPGQAFVATRVSAQGIMYNEQKIKKPVDSWAALWDKDFEGHVGVTGIQWGTGKMVTTAAFLMGGNEKSPDLGFNKLKELRKIKIFESASQVAQLFQQGEVWIAPQLGPAAYALQKSGMPIRFVLPKEGAFGMFDNMSIVKGGKEQLAALFINFALDPAVQVEHAKDLTVGPTNRKAVLPPDLQQKVPTGEQIGRLYLQDDRYANSQLPAWTERWNREVVPMITK